MFNEGGGVIVVYGVKLKGYIKIFAISRHDAKFRSSPRHDFLSFEAFRRFDIVGSTIWPGPMWQATFTCVFPIAVICSKELLPGIHVACSFSMQWHYDSLNQIRLVKGLDGCR